MGLEQNPSAGGALWGSFWGRTSTATPMELPELGHSSTPGWELQPAALGAQCGLGLAGECSSYNCGLIHIPPPVQWAGIIFQGMSHQDCCPPLGCCVQEFNAAAAAGIETFDIKRVFTKALDTCFYCESNALTMLMLCGVSLAFSKCLYSFYS